ncbi:hypothetical protein GCM10028783_12540 [Modestobacter muralis]
MTAQQVVRRGHARWQGLMFAAAAASCPGGGVDSGGWLRVTGPFEAARTRRRGQGGGRDRWVHPPDWH